MTEKYPKAIYKEQQVVFNMSMRRTNERGGFISNTAKLVVGLAAFAGAIGIVSKCDSDKTDKPVAANINAPTTPPLLLEIQSFRRRVIGTLLARAQYVLQNQKTQDYELNGVISDFLWEQRSTGQETVPLKVEEARASVMRLTAIARKLETIEKRVSSNVKPHEERQLIDAFQIVQAEAGPLPK